MRSSFRGSTTLKLKFKAYSHLSNFVTLEVAFFSQIHEIHREIRRSCREFYKYRCRNYRRIYINRSKVCLMRFKRRLGGLYRTKGDSNRIIEDQGRLKKIWRPRQNKYLRPFDLKID